MHCRSKGSGPSGRDWSIGIRKNKASKEKAGEVGGIDVFEETFGIAEVGAEAFVIFAL